MWRTKNTAATRTSTPTSDRKNSANRLSMSPDQKHRLIIYLLPLTQSGIAKSLGSRAQRRICRLQQDGLQRFQSKLSAVFVGCFSQAIRHHSNDVSLIAFHGGS